MINSNDKKKSSVSRLSNSFSTGGGGYNFERHVMALFLLSVVVDGMVPVLRYPAKKLLFQGKREGYHTDDLIVFTEGSGVYGKILCQIKHNLSITENNHEFREVMTAAWNDFSGNNINTDTDQIVLITGIISKTSIDALQTIHGQATAAENESDFILRMEQAKFVSNPTREKFHVVNKVLNDAKGEALSDSELWRFCKVFSLLIFDGEYETSFITSLEKTLIRLKCSEDPRHVMDRLCEYAGSYNEKGACVTIENYPIELKEWFGLKYSKPELVSNLGSDMWSIAALIGSWDENSNGDINTIQKLSGSEYDRFRSFVRQDMQSDNPNFSFHDGVYQLHRRKEIFELQIDLLYDDCINRAFDIASDLVVETSRRFYDDDQYSIIEPNDGSFSNSEAFRKSFLRGLCLLSNSRRPKNCSTHTIRNGACQLTRRFFAGCSWKRFASLGENLPVFAEIDSGTYLSELETYIGNNHSDIIRLFPRADEFSIFTPNFIANVLWSLERLAWIPDYFIQCIRCLSLLESLNYDKTNSGNTPLNSLKAILNPFNPQTCAEFTKIKNAIQSLEVDSVDLCWKIVVSVLPSQSFTFLTTRKPTYKKLPQYPFPNPNEAFQSIVPFYIRKAMELTTDAEQFVDLTNHIDLMDPKTRIDFFDKIVDLSCALGDDSKYKIWSSLCEKREDLIESNDGKEPDSEPFLKLEEAIAAIIPDSNWFRYQLVFTHHYGARQLRDAKKGWKAVERERINAVYSLFQEYGIDATVSFAEAVDDVRGIGYKLGAKIEKTKFRCIIGNACVLDSQPFLNGLIQGYYSKNPECTLCDLQLLRFEESIRLKILLELPIDAEVLDNIEPLLSDERLYWERVQVGFFYPNDTQSLVLPIIKKLMQYKRYTTAINSLFFSDVVNEIDDSILLELLTKAYSTDADEVLRESAVQHIVQRLQQSFPAHLDEMADIEFVYYPFLNKFSKTKPRFLQYKLANDPEYFCSFVGQTFRAKHETAKKTTLPEWVQSRLFDIIIQSSIVPGVDWNGDFQEVSFHNWMDYVQKWAAENDRNEVVQNTIGHGLSYANKENGLPNDAIVKELNKVDNGKMRTGYASGIVNQRGVHWVDREGKPELKLAEQYTEYAEAAAAKGYTRFSETLEMIAQEFRDEAQSNIQRHLAEQESRSEV